MIRRILFSLLMVSSAYIQAHRMPARPSFMDNFPHAGPRQGAMPMRQQPNIVPPPSATMAQKPDPKNLPTPPAPISVPPVFVPHQNASYDGPPPKTLVGSLLLPEKVTETPSFVAYYHGMRIDINNATYQLPDPFATEQMLHIIFTLASVQPVSANEDDANTIAGLAFDIQAPYKSFVIRRNPRYQARASIAPAHMAPQKDESPWLIAQTDLGNKKNMRLIPENAVIVLINPEHVISLESEMWGDRYANMARLPKIVLKKDLQAQTIFQMADHSALAALDLDAFHRRPTIISEVKKELPALVVSMVAELPHTA